MNKLTSTLVCSLAVVLFVSSAHAGVTLDGQRRVVQGNTFAIDGFFFEDSDSDSDRIASNQGGLFSESVDVFADTGFAGGAQAVADQFSTISDPATQGPELFISAEGSAEALVAIQGSASTKADSIFRVDFSLDSPGQIAFEDVLLKVESGANQGDASEARVILRVIDRDNGKRVFNKVVRLDNEGTTQTFADRFVVDLVAGRYRLLVRATADDETDGIEELVADGKASYFIEAEVTED